VAVARCSEEVEPVPALRADALEIDAKTLVAAQAGDRRAQEDFVRWYERRVHAFLGRSLLGRQHVDDLAQEVFLRVLCALPRFEPGPARVSTWIFSIAVHLLADHGRRQRRWFTWLDEERAPAHGCSPEEGAMAREALTDLEVALARLSAEQRMALCLCEMHGLSHAEVAEAMGTSVATVKTRLFRARHSLRKHTGASR
jgi:RNA polymerase sigma-70 factor, ECF subfamily